MKKKFYLALIVLSPIIGFSQTRILNSWNDPNVGNQNISIHKFVVAALINDQGTRRIVEDYMASQYPGIAKPYNLIYSLEIHWLVMKLI